MKHINKLKGILNVYFNWDKRRIDCFVKMLLGLISTQTINLSKIACCMADKTEIKTRYRRLQRFFSFFQIDYNVLAIFIFKLFGFDEREVYLTMDRTNWQWGKKNINILMLGIVHQGVAIPIYWIVLNKKGNSSTKERIALLNRFIKQFGKNCIKGVLADREFVGEKWFTYLEKEQLFFYIRIKKDVDTTNTRGLSVRMDWLFHRAKPQEKVILKGKRIVYKRKLNLCGMRLSSGDLLIIATNADVNRALEIYAKRWEVETLFQCLKSRGFYFEETHITNRTKIKKLIALLAIAYCWAHKTGEWREQQKPILVKKHGRLAQSIFRYGLDLLQDALMKLVYTIRPIMKFCKMLQLPKYQLIEVVK